MQEDTGSCIFCKSQYILFHCDYSVSKSRTVQSVAGLIALSTNLRTYLTWTACHPEKLRSAKALDLVIFKQLLSLLLDRFPFSKFLIFQFFILSKFRYL